MMDVSIMVGIGIMCLIVLNGLVCYIIGYDKGYHSTSGEE